MNEVNLIRERCRFCLERDATTATPLAFRPCCQQCRDKIQGELDKHNITAKAARGVLLDTFGRDGQPTPKRIHQYRNLTGPRSSEMPEHEDGWIGE